jgi:hypothetical protein
MIVPVSTTIEELEKQTRGFIQSKRIFAGKVKLNE